ncbi:MAG: hypothetical protein Q4A31_00080 [Corynebacterium sp.]|nr:hypothetical protein [Corynebacterium sp.]MDO4760305.1 hypothetical protein [Corynebacterium sp.]
MDTTFIVPPPPFHELGALGIVIHMFTVVVACERIGASCLVE